LSGSLHNILQQGDNHHWSTQILWNSTTQGYWHIPSSTTKPGASSPSCVLPSPGR
jgi:hypothetical protein